MAPPLDPGSDRVQACLLALKDLCAKFAVDGKNASVNHVAIKTKLSQQNLSKLNKHHRIGIDFADEIAAYYETTVDGLVWLFLRGGEGAVRVGDIPGWGRAVVEAKERWGAWLPFDVAADVRLPIGPNRATAKFAYELATFLHGNANVSQTRLRASKA